MNDLFCIDSDPEYKITDLSSYDVVTRDIMSHVSDSYPQKILPAFSKGLKKLDVQACFYWNQRYRDYTKHIFAHETEYPFGLSCLEASCLHSAHPYDVPNLPSSIAYIGDYALANVSYYEPGMLVFKQKLDYIGKEAFGIHACTEHHLHNKLSVRFDGNVKPNLLKFGTWPFGLNPKNIITKTIQLYFDDDVKKIVLDDNGILYATSAYNIIDVSTKELDNNTVKDEMDSMTLLNSKLYIYFKKDLQKIAGLYGADCVLNSDKSNKSRQLIQKRLYDIHASSVVSADDYCFDNCTQLKETDFALKYAGKNAFCKCCNLHELELSALKFADECAFAQSGLSIDLNLSSAELRACCFESTNVSNAFLSSCIVMPYAFKKCLKHVKAEDSLLFENSFCQSYVETAEFDKCLLRSYAFKDSPLTYVRFNELSTSELEFDTFSGCNRLYEIKVQNMSISQIKLIANYPFGADERAFSGNDGYLKLATGVNKQRDKFNVCYTL